MMLASLTHALPSSSHIPICSSKWHIKGVAVLYMDTRIAFTLRSCSDAEEARFILHSHNYYSMAHMVSQQDARTLSTLVVVYFSEVWRRRDINLTVCFLPPPSHVIMIEGKLKHARHESLAK